MDLEKIKNRLKLAIQALEIAKQKSKLKNLEAESLIQFESRKKDVIYWYQKLISAGRDALVAQVKFSDNTWTIVTNIPDLSQIIGLVQVYYPDKEITGIKFIEPLKIY